METISTASYFNLSRVGSNQLQFTWKAQSLMELKVSLVRVIAKSNSSSGIDRYATAWASSEIVTVDALEPYTPYNVTVEATGEGIHFMQHMGLIRTWPTAPPPMAAPTGRSISNTKIKLEWSKPSQVNGILEPYRATCFNLMQIADPTSVTTEDNETTTAIVDNLHRNTKYKCVVEASTIPANGQDSKECTRMSSSSSPIQTMDAAMLKPTFEATCYEENEALDLLIHKPEDVEGDFGGFEVLLRIGSPIMQNPWYSEVNLTSGELEYKVDGLIPSIPYSITVRGLVLPDTYSDMADPLTFQVLNANHSVPQNVKLEAVDSRTVNMTWDQPAKLNGLITGFTIKWSVDNGEQQMIHLTPCEFHVFTKLEPQVTVSAAIRTHYQPNVPMKFEYVGTFSGLVTASTLPVNRGGRIGRSPQKHSTSIRGYTSVPPVTITEIPTPTHTFATSADTEPTSAPAATTDGSDLTPEITTTGHSPSSPPIITIMEHASTPLLIPSTISASTSTITEMEISAMVPETAATSEPISTPSFIMESLSKSSPPIAMTSGFTSDSVITTTKETPSTTKSPTTKGSTSVHTVTTSKPTSNPVVTTTKGFTLPPGTTISKRFESSPVASSSEVPASTPVITASKRPTSTSLITTTTSSKPKLSIAITERSVQTSATTTTKRLSSTPKISSTRELTLKPLGTTGGSTLIPEQTATRVSASTPAIKKPKRHSRSPAMTKGKAPASLLATSAIESSTSTFVVTTTRAPAMTSSITTNGEPASTPPKTTNKMNLSIPAVITTKASAQTSISTNTEDSPSTFITSSGLALTFATSAIALTCMAAVLV
ncbi:Oncosphere antigen A [Taenia solium]|eukprot:TsM_000855200 transcript=TsM_000855200 gene=TsM_000855200